MAERGEPLSERELDVLRRLAVGESNKAIADGLSISPLTVKTHLRNIYTKLDVSTRTEALNAALQQRLISVYVEKEADEVLPVSYTHLDVYKRQMYRGSRPLLAGKKSACRPFNTPSASSPL